MEDMTDHTCQCGSKCACDGKTCTCDTSEGKTCDCEACKAARAGDSDTVESSSEMSE